MEDKIPVTAKLPSIRLDGIRRICKQRTCRERPCEMAFVTSFVTSFVTHRPAIILPKAVSC